ncbi:MAG: hypothetical protein K2H43_05395 [Clostridia bacterium]|nr:hypothetical protein [Clostridia bacterium]
MAKRQRTESAARNSFIKACSFIGILISAVLYLVGGILSWFGGSLGSLGSWMNLIASIALLIGVAFPAWDFVKYKKKLWRIVYWVALVVYIVGVVFGIVSIYR